MPTPYYKQSGFLPEIADIIVGVIKTYYASVIYLDEDIADAVKRMILTPIQQGSDAGIRFNLDFFKKTNVKFPFTAFNIGEQSIDENKLNYLAQSREYYSKTYDCRIATWPMIMEMPMISFFTTSFDYQRLHTILEEDFVGMTKLDVPFTLNGRDASIIIEINLEISKGSYTYEFEEWLKINNILDLVHNLTVKYYNIVSDGKIQPIDDGDIYLRLHEIESGIQTNEYIAPRVTVSVPVDDQRNYAITLPITLTFNQTMIPETIEEAFSTVPSIEGAFEWNAGFTEMTFIAENNLPANTNIIVTVLSSGQATTGVELGEEFSFNFQT